MMKNKIVFDYLEKLIPNPKAELMYDHDYELLIAVMLSAHSTDKIVNRVTSVLFKKYPNLEALKEADIRDIEDIIKPVGTWRIKAGNVLDIASKLALIGHVPNDREFLESLKGVGRKTANVVLSALYNEPYLAVDTHIARVSVRLGFANEKDDVRTIENKLMKVVPKTNMIDNHNRLLLFGRHYCKAINPMCKTCGLIDICKYKKKNL